MYVLLAGLIGIFGLFSLWFIDKRSDIPKKLSKKHKIILTLGAVLSISLVIGGAYQMMDREKSDTSDNQPTIPAATKIKIDDKSPLQYKVLDEKKSGESLRVTVITPETADVRLIAINDKLFPQYKDKAKSLFIDYFDDEAIAKIYFSKISDPKLKENDKKNLVSHYIALMTASQFSGNKLFKISPGNSILKTY